jgi:hypothetical protein
MKVNEFHLRSINSLLGEAFANGKHNFSLVFLLIANADAVLILLGACGSEGMDEIDLNR